MAGEPPKTPLQKKLLAEAEPETLEDTLDGLELKVDRLKVLYDQYFMGIEKIEPLVPRKEVNRTIINLAKIQIRNTGLRFRYRTLVQRFNVHITYWNRILREIELGTYKRDVLRAGRAMAAKGAELPPEMAAALKPRDRERLRASAPAPAAAAKAERTGQAGEQPTGGEVLELEADEPSAPRVLELEADEPSAPRVLELEADEPSAPHVLELEADEPPPPRPAPPRPPTPPAGTARPPTPMGSAPVRPPTPMGSAPVRPPTPMGSAPVRPPTPMGTAPVRPPTPMGSAPVRPPTPAAGAAIARVTPVARPATPPAGSARPPTPMGTAPVGAAGRTVAGGMTREQIDGLYRRLINAKKLCGEPTGGLTADSLAATIDKTAPKVMQEKGCREVEFTVVIKNDKAILKAIPKK